MMKSPIADIVNSAPVREAHPIQGAAFLSYFVEAGIPWAHIDIAGTHATEKDKGCYIAGPTGYGARLIAETIERM
jgi:leucyl aminopeptidase